MAKIEDLSPGQVLYTVTKQRSGNTKISRTAVHSVKIVSIHPDLGYVVASWNCNQERKYFAKDVAKWRTIDPRL